MFTWCGTIIRTATHTATEKQPTHKKTHFYSRHIRLLLLALPICAMPKPGVRSQARPTEAARPRNISPAVQCKPLLRGGKAKAGAHGGGGGRSTAAAIKAPISAVEPIIIRGRNRAPVPGAIIALCTGASLGGLRRRLPPFDSASASRILTARRGESRPTADRDRWSCGKAHRAVFVDGTAVTFGLSTHAQLRWRRVGSAPTPSQTPKKTHPHRQLLCGKIRRWKKQTLLALPQSSRRSYFAHQNDNPAVAMCVKCLRNHDAKTGVKNSKNRRYHYTFVTRSSFP